MNRRMIVAAALAAATLGTAGQASAQVWGAPPPPPPYGYAPPPPPPPPYVAGRAYWDGYGYGPRYRHGHCWTEYRRGGWERVRVCD